MDVGYQLSVHALISVCAGVRLEGFTPVGSVVLCFPGNVVSEKEVKLEVLMDHEYMMSLGLSCFMFVLHFLMVWGYFWGISLESVNVLKVFHYDILSLLRSPFLCE